MAILLTNGVYYISLNKNGGVLKVTDIRKAKDFVTIENAIEQKNKTPGRCRNYYHINLDINIPKQKDDKVSKRKKFSPDIRKKVYKKTEGHCYLCGDFVDYNSFEVEHNIPISKGGTNDFDNLFCSCHTCNMIKQDIYPEDFMERIAKIFIHQMKMQSKRSLRWKILHSMLIKQCEKSISVDKSRN